MSRVDLAILWFGGYTLVLVFANAVIGYIENRKATVKGVQPQIEVFGRKYKKRKSTHKNIWSALKNFLTRLYYERTVM